jgi:hypothetical protein
MTTFNTGNPIPSAAPQDLFDNAQSFDDGMHGQGDTFKDRFGRDRYTWHRFETMTQGALDQINPTVAAAKAAVTAAKDAGVLDIGRSVAAVDTAEAAAKADMLQTASELGDDLNNKRYATYAEMVADPQARDAVVGVVDADANSLLNGWYSWDATASVWERFADQPASGKALDSVGARTSILEASAVRADKLNDAHFAFSIADDVGQVAFGILEDGSVYAGGISADIEELQDSTVKTTTFEDTTNYVWGITDRLGRVALGVTPDGAVVANTVPESVSAVSTYVTRSPLVSGLTVLLASSALVYGGQSNPLANVTAAAATSVTESVTDYPLTYIVPVSMPITEFLKVDAAQWLGYSSVSITSVVNQATGLPLVAGVDYAYTENGKLVRMAAGSALTVTVNFIGFKERYDLIVYNLNTRGVVIRQGVERRITAHEDAYRAKPLAGDIPLYSLYVVGSVIKDIIDVSDWRGTRHRSSNGEQAALIEQNRYRLRRFLTKLNRGDGVIVTGYGDSNTALGGSRGDDSAYVANRPDVDTLSFQGDYLMSTFEADFRAAYLASVGQVTVKGQVRNKTSPNWGVIDKITKGYGYTFVADRVPVIQEVVYLNQGIATTTAGNTAQGGTTPARLAAMINPVGYRTPDLVIIAFGMNDRADINYVSNIEQIATAVLAAGADAIVVGPHLTNTFSASFNQETWHLIHRRLMECADRLGIAFFPSELFYAGKNRGYLGISDYSLTRANFANHPGPYEYRMLGEALANSFL